MLATVFALTRFHHYTCGHHVIVESDHKPLESITKKAVSSSNPKETIIQQEALRSSVKRPFLLEQFKLSITGRSLLFVLCPKDTVIDPFPGRDLQAQGNLFRI